MSLRCELFEILRAFASLVPPRKISFSRDISPPIMHAFFLEQILMNSHLLQYPPSEQYQKIFWKWAIHNLENMASVEDFEIDSRIYEHYLTLLPSSRLSPGSARPDHRGELCPYGLSPKKPLAPSYITHFWKPLQYVQQDCVQNDYPLNGIIQLDGYETVTLLEARTTIESGTTGLRTWLASFVLSEYLAKHPGLLKNNRILELGSGVGFLGIIITRLQQLSSKLPDPSHPTVWLTDVNENVLSRCRDNIQLPCNRSSSSSNVNYRFVDWTDSQHPDRIAPLKSLIQNEIDADLILGADIIFDPSLLPALAGVLHLALQPGHTASPKTALVAATIRNQETFDQFVHSVQREGLQVRELQAETDQTTFMQDIDGAGESVKIFQITL